MPLSRALQYVTGKGGVGKSMVAAALVLDAAARGRRVLGIELGEPGGLARILEVAPGDPGDFRDVPGVPGAALTWFEGGAALAEYLLRRMRLGRIGRALIAHPMYRALVAAAPGVRELMVIGKVRDELVLQRRWDAIVVDAGASGHAIEHLRMPAAAARVFGGGLVHREAERNARLLADPATCAVHVVATPEAMPVAEAAQVIAQLAALGLPRGAVLMNQCRPAAPPDAAVAIAAIAEPALAEVARRALAWSEVQERGAAALAAAAAAPVVRLPQVWIERERERAAALAAAIGGVP